MQELRVRGDRESRIPEVEELLVPFRECRGEGQLDNCSLPSSNELETAWIIFV